MNDFVVVLSTVPGDFDASHLAHELVGAGLAACVTIVPGIRSVYTWNGMPQVDDEQQLLIKTTGGQVDALWDALRARHPYDTPEFIVVPVIDGSEEYLRWIDQSVGPRPES
ncbi:MAG: divalent-cation tolerance protein CutA [Acidobacteriota bacterium]|jgi:periplasmic divalent cation tolerance protein|nr:MAG: divalent-cation tolerance protein CutA [Acidobacteriota bacterium]